MTNAGLIALILANAREDYCEAWSNPRYKVNTNFVGTKVSSAYGVENDTPFIRFKDFDSGRVARVDFTTHGQRYSADQGIDLLIFEDNIKSWKKQLCRVLKTMV